MKTAREWVKAMEATDERYVVGALEARDREVRVAAMREAAAFVLTVSLMSTSPVSWQLGLMAGRVERGE